MIRVLEFSLRAFRGYPKHESFDLGDGQSLLIFGRNGHGKSSISDAFEFLVNADGTLERLGLRKGPTTSGTAPLKNVRLVEGEPSQVTLVYHDGATDASVVREVSESKSTIPPSLAPFAEASVVPFVIRGPELRRFVYETPQRRYEELARFLNASRLIVLQREIRELQKSLGKDQGADDDSLKRVAAELKTATDGALREWDEQNAIAWMNGLLADVGLDHVRAAAFSDPALAELKVLEANERSTTALESAKMVLDEILRTEEDGRTSIVSWRDALVKARETLSAAVSGVAEVPIADVMDAAEHYLADNTHSPDQCPLCTTPYRNSPLGSRKAVLANIAVIRERLAAFTAAREAVQSEETILKDLHEQWWLRAVTALAACGIDDARSEAIEKNLRAAFEDETRIADLQEAAKRVVASLEAARSERARSASGRCIGLYQKIDSALNVINRIRAIESRSSLRERFKGEIDGARGYIDSRVHGFFTSTVEAISKRTVAFYAAVQRNAIVPVRVKVGMVPEENENNRGIEVLIDFDNETDQKPQAYLSDSQQNTLALGLRLAIIQHFNTRLPFVVLDDVVTSFDAEMRKTTAEALVDQLAGIQMIVLTHDDMFWQALRDYVKPRQANWRVKRIGRFSREEGPLFLDDKPDEQEVLDAIVSGRSVGAAIRGYWDTWLRNFAREVGARPLMPAVTDPFNYAASDLFNAIIKATSSSGLKKQMEDDPKVRRIVEMLKSNAFLNRATHRAEPIDGSPSDGDLADIFNDILAFKALFQCDCANPCFAFVSISKVILCTRCKTPLKVSAAPAS